jgi:hypothetical protein
VGQILRSGPIDGWSPDDVPRLVVRVGLSVSPCHCFSGDHSGQADLRLRCELDKNSFKRLA